MRPLRRDDQHDQIAREPLQRLKVEWRILAWIQSCIILTLPYTWQGKATTVASMMLSDRQGGSGRLQLGRFLQGKL
jgi:hypothetical protein